MMFTAYSLSFLSLTLRDLLTLAFYL